MSNSIVDRINAIINNEKFRDYTESQIGFVGRVVINHSEMRVILLPVMGPPLAWEFSDFLEFERFFNE